MEDELLIGWKKIHEHLFCDKVGKPIISHSTLTQKYGKDLKACGAVFGYLTGRSRRFTIAGWASVIMNYFILLGQQKEAEKAKLPKRKRKNTPTELTKHSMQSDNNGTQGDPE